MENSVPCTALLLNLPHQVEQREGGNREKNVIILLLGMVKSLAGSFSQPGRADGLGESALMQYPYGLWYSSDSGSLYGIGT